MFLARLHSSIEQAPAFRQHEIQDIKRACIVHVTGDHMRDLLEASAGVNKIRHIQANLQDSPQVSIRLLAGGISAAPMARTEIEEDFV